MGKESILSFPCCNQINKHNNILSNQKVIKREISIFLVYLFFSHWFEETLMKPFADVNQKRLDSTSTMCQWGQLNISELTYIMCVLLVKKIYFRLKTYLLNHIQ